MPFPLSFPLNFKMVDPGSLLALAKKLQAELQVAKAGVTSMGNIGRCQQAEVSTVVVTTYW